MLRWLTAGESHGPALAAVLEGLPAGVEVGSAEIDAALARRRLGYGRGARMGFEADALEIMGGIRHGRTLGGTPVRNVAASVTGGPVVAELELRPWPEPLPVLHVAGTGT